MRFRSGEVERQTTCKDVKLPHIGDDVSRREAMMVALKSVEIVL